MMQYNELLNILSSQISSNMGINEKVQTTNLSSNEEKNTSVLLNKLGLEIQRREGGY